MSNRAGKSVVRAAPAPPSTTTHVGFQTSPFADRFQVSLGDLPQITPATTDEAKKSLDKGLMRPLQHRCQQCLAIGPHLLRCGGCCAVRYCNHEHQVAHRPKHKSSCNRVKKARAKLAEEEAAVHGLEPDPFDEGIGRFEIIEEMREYTQALALLSNWLLEMNTLDSVREALEHMNNMMRLCRLDIIGMRNTIPIVMLRLDLDQECYDFIKWWALAAADEDYEWGDMDEPYLDICGANVFEAPNFLADAPLGPIVPVLLLKLKLLVDIRNLKVTRKICALRGIPVELRDMIEVAVIQSPLSCKLQRKDAEDLSKIESRLVTQVRQLGVYLQTANEYFVDIIFSPAEALNTSLRACPPKSWKEAAFMMQVSMAAFCEMQGILLLLHEAALCAQREKAVLGFDSVEISRLVDAGGLSTVPRDPDELSIKWALEYIGYAQKNDSYLGPRSKRPSERYTRQKQEAAEWETDDESVHSGDLE